MSDFSDDDFVETHFIEPSPVKKRKLLTDIKKWKASKEKLEKIAQKMKEIDEEFDEFMRDKNKISLTSPSSVEKISSSTEEKKINVYPEGRTYFKECFQQGELEPSKWFSEGSIFSEMDKEYFIYYVNQGYLHVLRNEDERNTVRQYALMLLKIDLEPHTAGQLLKFLSSLSLKYETVHLRDWSPSHFPRMLEILSSSVQRFSPNEAKNTFRELCLSSLDRRLLSSTHAFPSILSDLLFISTTIYPANEEIDWLLCQDLKPEECFHMLRVLPDSGKFKEFSLEFALRSAIQIAAPKEVECSSFADLISFLKGNTKHIHALPLNSTYNLLNILNFYILRTSDSNKVLYDDITTFLSDLKALYKEKKEIPILTVTEVINRMLNTTQQY